MSPNRLLSGKDFEEPHFSFTKVDRDRDSTRNPLNSVTAQGVTSDGKSVSKARIPLDEENRAVISEDTFGNNSELAWLIANLLEVEGWDYVEG